jgi:hypothetical protein
MRSRWIIATLALIVCAPAMAQKPTPDEQKSVLDAAREHAIHYTSKLPDFICTEQVMSSQSAPGQKKIDRLSIQLGFNGQKEHYKLVAMNGSPTKQSLDSFDGLITVGEFGTQLLGIFDPASSADFQWKELTNLRKHAAVVYTYRIARAKSHYMLGYRAADGNLVTQPAGYHGEIVLEQGTSRVLRLTAQADDMPKESGILQSSVDVDYDFITIAGKSYLLPSRSDSGMERGFRKIGNTVTFTGYRKFEADSTIDFKD